MAASKARATSRSWSQLQGLELFYYFNSFMKAGVLLCPPPLILLTEAFDLYRLPPLILYINGGEQGNRLGYPSINRGLPLEAVEKPVSIKQK
jgi:hypothetical protein